jgi:Ser/Thr protein kinase RdoA (MazF antagonist)
MSKNDSRAIAESEREETLLRIARAALAVYDLPPQIDVRPIRVVNNAVFEVVAEGALRLALRIHRPGYRAVEHIQSELNRVIWLNHVVASRSVLPWRSVKRCPRDAQPLLPFRATPSS